MLLIFLRLLAVIDVFTGLNVAFLKFLEVTLSFLLYYIALPRQTRLKNTLPLRNSLHNLTRLFLIINSRLLQLLYDIVDAIGVLLLVDEGLFGRRRVSASPTLIEGLSR